MSARKKVRRLITRARSRPALARAMRRWPDRMYVLMYHRVVDPLDAPGDYKAIISATPDGFHRQLRWIRARFDVVSLDDLRAIAAGRLSSPAHPLLITFDDGYVDNHQHARPALRDAGLPAVAFLPTRWVGSDVTPWWDRIARLLSSADVPRIDVPPIGRLDTSSERERNAAEARLMAAAKTLDEKAREELVTALSHAVDRSPWPDRGSPQIMDWTQAAEMERDGIACQPHTASHARLASCADDEIVDEIQTSVEDIESRLSRKASAFAFPYGERSDYDARSLATLRAASIELAFSAEPGVATLAALMTHPFELERITVNRFDDPASLAVKCAER